MKQLFFVRHGSVYNPDGVMYRRLPGFHLSEQGRRETAETARFLGSKAVERIYYSPLERAVETAEIIATVAVAPLEVDERIHEWGEDERPEGVLKRMAAFLKWWENSDETVAAAVSHREPSAACFSTSRAGRGPIRTTRSICRCRKRAFTG